MKRGEVWTISGGKDYAGKTRPAVIIQDDNFDYTSSIIICPFTSNETDAPLFRLSVEPKEQNGLQAVSRLMIDKIAAIPKAKLGACIGRLDDADMLRLNQAALVFLGLAVSSRSKR